MDLGKADKTLRNLKGKDTAYTVALGDGICTRVAPNGTRTLELRARLNGTLQRYRLGHYPATTIAAAVAKAAEYRAMLREGLSPKVAEQRARGGGDVPRNVSEAAERFIAGHLKVKTRERWADEAQRIINTEILPVLGKHPLVQLQRTDLTALVERKAGALRAKNQKGVMANRIAAVLSKLFGWCASQGWVPGDLARNLPKPAKETAKDRTLTPGEAGALWLMLEECTAGGGPIPQVHARVLQLLALTGCRCSEITSITRQRIDPDNGLLTVTGGKTQASNRTLPLTAAARGVIEPQAAVGEKEQDLLFPSPRVGKVIPSNEISRSARDLVKLLKHTSWTPHDLRRTAITVMAEAGIDGDIRRRVTGHQAADIHGRIYDRAARLEDMRAALLVVERWYTDAAAKVAAGADQGNVVSIRTGKGQ